MPAVSRSVGAREVLDHAATAPGVVSGRIGHGPILARWFAQGPAGNSEDAQEHVGCREGATLVAIHTGVARHLQTEARG